MSQANNEIKKKNANRTEPNFNESALVIKPLANLAINGYKPFQSPKGENYHGETVETQIYTTEAFVHESNVDRPLYIRFHSSTLFFSINTVVFFGRFRKRGFTQTLPKAHLVLALKLMVQEFLLEPSIKADGQFDIFLFSIVF